jgi:hypothetical protein
MSKDLDDQSHHETPKLTAGGASNSADKVGYCQPPKHSRFKPGQSGNTSGRRKHRRSFKMDLMAALDAQCRDADGDATKQQKIAENLVNDLLARDALALKIIIPIVLALDGIEDDDEGEPTALQQKLIEDFARREGRADSATTPSQNGGDHE